MLNSNGLSEEARRPRKENLKRQLLQRLSVPSVVRRYEIGYDGQPHGLASSDASGRSQILGGLHPMDAMAISQPIKISGHDYLTLRHQQNLEWAQDRFDKGVGYAKAALEPSIMNKNALLRKAESCYKEGLDMIPHHVQILTAYGALCANDGRLEMAKKMLQKAIAQCEHGNGDGGGSCHNADTIKDAKTYLTVIESKMHTFKTENGKNARKNEVTLSNKAEKAVNDALAERAFVMGDDPKSLQHSAAATSKYQLLSSPSNESSAISENERRSLRRRRRRSHHSERTRKKYRKRERSSRGDHHRRRKHRRKEELSNDSSEDDEYSSFRDEGRDRRKKHRRKVKKEKRKRRFSKKSRSRSRSE